MEEDKGTVCVTGGTGFIASWLIMKLLEHGYSVQTTVRSDPEKKRDLSFLTHLPGASEKLQIFNADLSDPDSFEAAIEGCISVFHVATTVDFEVKRVVYTSSASTVEFSGKNFDIVDESSWSDVDYIRQSVPVLGSYMISKTLTERAALRFAKENGLDLVTLIPSFVVGPFICPKFPSSVRSTLAMILGNKEEYIHLLNISMVHVDDVARVHIFLLEYSEAKGRYNCSSHTITIKQMSEFLSAKYPEYPIPTTDSLAEIKGYKAPELSSKKLLDTGFKYKYGLDEMFDGAIQCCKEKGYL